MLTDIALLLFRAWNIMQIVRFYSYFSVFMYSLDSDLQDIP